MTSRSANPPPDFDGAYVDLRVLSAHELSSAYAGRDPQSDRKVFIKLLDAAKIHDREAVETFRREAYILLAVARRAPSLPRMLAMAEWQGRPYFVQQLLEGWTLDRLAMSPMAGSAVIGVLEGTLDVLAAIHAAGFVHGDISPDNIFVLTDAPIPTDGVMPDGFRVTLVDFNSARAIDSPAASRLLLKRQYAAPELARGVPMSPQSDLYSLGITAYELITGALPYELATPDWSRATLSDVPAMSPALEVPQLVEEFVRGLLATDPSHRPRSSDEVRQRLRALTDVHAWMGRTAAPDVVMTGGWRSTPNVVREAPRAVPPTTMASVPVASAPPPPPQEERFNDRASVCLAVPVPAGRSGETDRVDFSIFAPPSVAPGRSFVLEVWAYLRQQADEALERAKRQSRMVERISRGPVLVPSATELTILLRLDDFEVTNSQDSFFWSGDIVNVPFLARTPERLAPGIYPGQVSVLHAGVLLTRIVFDLAVGAPIDEPVTLGSRRDRLSSAFASYASDDRAEVLRRVQGLGAAGVDVFLDVLELRAGQDWEAMIHRHIREDDVFYLFWSVAASRSRWVDREWRYALDQRGLEYIHPIPLSDPREAPPPPELASRHFNDVYLAWLRSEALLRRREDTPH